MLIQNRAIENVIFIVFPSLVLPGKAKGKPERLLPNIACAKDVSCSKQRCVYEDAVRGNYAGQALRTCRLQGVTVWHEMDKIPSLIQNGEYEIGNKIANYCANND